MMVAQEPIREREAKKPYYERFGYGDILIGSGKDFRAIIDIDYIELKR